MLTVSGKIESAKDSKSGKSISLRIDGQYVSVDKKHLDQFKDAVGAGKAIPVQVRTSIELNSDGTPKTRTYRDTAGALVTVPDVKYNLWFKPAGSSADLAALVGADLVQE
jgi:hypothetical protein